MEIRLAALITLLPLLALSQSASSQTFLKDVAPVIGQKCIQCHGHSSKMGDLDLETREGFLKGGKHGASVVAGNAAESRLYKHLIGQLQPRMPLGGQLTAEQIAVFKSWIDSGAQWDPTAALTTSCKELLVLPTRGSPRPHLHRRVGSRQTSGKGSTPKSPRG